MVEKLHLIFLFAFVRTAWHLQAFDLLKSKLLINASQSLNEQISGIHPVYLYSFIFIYEKYKNHYKHFYLKLLVININLYCHSFFFIILNNFYSVIYIFCLAFVLFLIKIFLYNNLHFVLAVVALVDFHINLSHKGLQNFEMKI